MIKKFKDLAYQIRNQPKLDDDPFVMPMRFGRSQGIIFAVLAVITFVRGWSLTSMYYFTNYGYYCPSAEHIWDYDECEKVCRGDFNTILFKGDFEIICHAHFQFMAKLSVLVSGIGGCILGILTDVYGRKRILNVSSIGFLLSSILIVAASNTYVFICGTCLRMVFINGSMISGFVLISEIIGRNKLGILITFIFSFMDLGAIALIVGASLLRQWRVIEIIITIFSVLLLSSLFVVPETPRWYFAKDNVVMAAKTLKALIRKNKMKPDNVDERLGKMWRDLRCRPKSYDGFFDIFKYVRLRQIFFIFAFLQFIISLIFDVERINIPPFTHHPFDNAIITNVIITICRIVFSLVLRRLANKDVLIIALIFNCIGELLIAFLTNKKTSASIWVNAIVEGITWATVNPVMVTYYIELFPTNIRGTTYGVFIIFDLIGFFLSTLVSTLAVKCAWLPGAFNFLFSFIACFVSANLPQIPTNALPQCSRDAEFAARDLDPAYPLYAVHYHDT